MESQRKNSEGRGDEKPKILVLSSGPQRNEVLWF